MRTRHRRLPSGDGCPNDQASTESGQEDHLTLIRRTRGGIQRRVLGSPPIQGQQCGSNDPTGTAPKPDGGSGTRVRGPPGRCPRLRGPTPLATWNGTRRLPTIRGRQCPVSPPKAGWWLGTSMPTRRVEKAVRYSNRLLPLAGLVARIDPGSLYVFTQGLRLHADAFGWVQQRNSPQNAQRIVPGRHLRVRFGVVEGLETRSCPEHRCGSGPLRTR